MFYATAVGLPILYGKITEKYKCKQLDALAIIIFSFLMSLRAGTGTDLHSYSQFFARFAEGMTLRQEYYESYPFEPGFALVNFIMAKCGLPFGVFLFAVSVFNLSVLCLYVRKYEIKNKGLVLFFYFIIFDIFLSSLQIIRQSIAISFYFLAVIELEKHHGKKHCLKAALLVLIGASFHWTALLALPLLFFFYFKREIRVSSLFLIAVIVPFVYNLMFNTSFAAIFSQVLGGTAGKRLDYYTNIYYADSIGIKSTFHMLVWLCISIGWIVFVSTFQYGNGKASLVFSTRGFLTKRISLSIAEWSVIFFLITKECLYIYRLDMLTRFQMYFFFFVPFVIVGIIRRFKGDFRTNLIVVLVVMFLYRFVESCIELNETFGSVTYNLANYFY